MARTRVLRTIDILVPAAVLAAILVVAFVIRPSVGAKIECDQSGFSTLNGVRVTPPPDWMQPIAGP